MATSIIISCPQCRKQSKAPAEVQGKRIRCKECGHIFAVKAPESKASSAKRPSKGPQQKPQDEKVRSLAEQMIEEEFGDDSNPYDVTDTDLRPRCPHCASAMDEGDVICLECGYNTQTRMHGRTTRVMGATFIERAIWLSPGIACVLAVGGLIALICYLWIGLPGHSVKDPQSWLWWFFDNLPTQIYGTVFSLLFIFLAGKFAVKRLIFHPNPPEKLKR